MFFARLGSATPKGEGISGVIGAGLEAAEETLPQAIQTKRDYDAKQEQFAERRDALAVAKRGEERLDTKDIRRTKMELSNKLFTGKKDLSDKEWGEYLNAAEQDIKIARDNLAIASSELN